MMMAGATKLMTTRSQVGIVAFGMYGYDMSRSTRENGRLYGPGALKAAPIAAIAL